MFDRRPSKPVPTRSQAYQSAVFSALMAAAVTLVVLKFLMGLAFGAAIVVGIGAFIMFFGMALRMTPRREE